MPLRPRLAALLATTLALACTEDPPARVAEPDAPRSIASAYCDREQRCECPSTDASTCMSEVEGSFDERFAEARALGLTYDGACVGSMIDAQADDACEPPDPTPSSAPLCGACKPYHGSAQAGAPCEIVDNVLFDDCAAGLYCAQGTCVDPCEPAAIGEPCVLLECAAGSTCVVAWDAVLEATDSECVANVGEGEACDEHPCAPSLVCDLDQRCSPLPTLGEPCNGECEDGAWCTYADSDAQLCVPRLADGEPCSDDRACLGRCDEETDVCAPELPAVCIDR